MKIVNGEKRITAEDVAHFLAGANAAAQSLGHPNVPARIEFTNIDGDEAMEGYDPLSRTIRCSIPNQHERYKQHPVLLYKLLSVEDGAHAGINAVLHQERTPIARALHYMRVPFAKFEARVRRRSFHDTYPEEKEVMRRARELADQFDF